MPCRWRDTHALHQIPVLGLWAALLAGAAGWGRWQQARGEPIVDHPPPQASPPAKGGADPFTASAATALRAETLERLKALEPPSGLDTTTSGGSANPGAAAGAAAAKSDGRPSARAPSSAASHPTANTPLRDLLQDRLKLLDEFAKVSQALSRATDPDPSPQRQIADAKEELHRLEQVLAQAAKVPESLLPACFRGKATTDSSALIAEMKDALEATTNELRDWKSRVESARSQIATWESLQSARHTERDKLFQRVTNLKAKSEEFEGAVTDAQTAHARELAHQELVNFQWEARVESLQLQTIEAQIGLEVKLAEVRDLTARAHDTHVRIAERTLEEMRARYRVIAEDHERDLKRAADSEESKAQQSGDPLERFRARRTSELLVLEMQVNKSEQALATDPSPSYEEQKDLADRAERDFARIRELLDDGRVSRLDAIRLNNEFRRIGPERDRLLKSEMAAVEAHLQFYENALTNVEIELVQNALHDRFEHDLLRERVSPSRWAEGEALLTEIERKHRALLVRRRIALEKLCDRASHTQQQVARRLGILDEEYGFIRTHIFWVRDQDAIGLATLTQAAREFNHVVKGLIWLAEEVLKPNLWGQPSAEFMVTALAVLALPPAIVRLRRFLRARIGRGLPPSLV
jgi:potassium efflux system protein